MFSIGQVSQETGCKIPTIRFYEQAGLLSEPWRTEGNQRRYAESHIKRLRFILHARELGFSLDDIRDLISLSLKTSSEHEADDIAKRQLAEVERKLSRLEALRSELRNMLDACHQGQNVECSVINVLSDHTLCHGEH